MSERTQELKRLYQRYGTDSAALLAEYPSMENLRVFPTGGKVCWSGMPSGRAHPF